MLPQYRISVSRQQASHEREVALAQSPERAQQVAQALERFLEPLLVVLDRSMDARLVRTLLATVSALLICAQRSKMLLVSELGGLILSPAQAPAGAKRLERLLHSPQWSGQAPQAFLWQQADEQLDRLEAQGQVPLCVWDGSVLEKPESQALTEGAPVRSNKARRLRRSRPKCGKGYFNRMGGPPIVVPGLQWTAVILLGCTKGVATLVANTWWSTRGTFARFLRDVEAELFDRIALAWGQRVLHVFDRGFAGSFWLQLHESYETRFVIRWVKRFKLFSLDGEELATWQLARGKRAWDHRLLQLAGFHDPVRVGVLAVPVRHPSYAGPLWLVICRTGREPWYAVSQ